MRLRNLLFIIPLIALLLFQFESAELPQIKNEKLKQEGIAAELLIKFAEGVAGELGGQIVNQIFMGSDGANNYQEIVHEFEKYENQEKIYNQKANFLGIIDSWENQYHHRLYKLHDTAFAARWLDSISPSLTKIISLLNDPDIASDAVNIYTLAANLRLVFFQESFRLVTGSITPDTTYITNMNQKAAEYHENLCQISGNIVNTRLAKISASKAYDDGACYTNCDHGDVCQHCKFFKYPCYCCSYWQYTDGDDWKPTYYNYCTGKGVKHSGKTDIDASRVKHVKKIYTQLYTDNHWYLKVTGAWKNLIITNNDSLIVNWAPHEPIPVPCSWATNQPG